MLVLSRKPGESIVLEFVAFTRKTEAVPSRPVTGKTEPTGSGGGTPAPCQAVAAFASSGDRTLRDADRPGPQASIASRIPENCQRASGGKKLR
jgi:hypothetical protein